MNFVVEWAAKNKPDIFKTELQKELAKHGHLLIFTPPYCPEFQPIELLWGFVKGTAAALWKPKRTVPDLIRDLETGFYGRDSFFYWHLVGEEDPLKKLGHDAELGATRSRCHDWVSKCFKEMGKAANADPELLSMPEFAGLYSMRLSVEEARQRAVVKSTQNLTVRPTIEDYSALGPAWYRPANILGC